MKSVTVVKFGGSLSKNENAKKKFIRDLSVLARKEPVVLVHGGGPEINAWLGRLDIKSTFVEGLRYTDAPTLEIVEMALSGKVNKALAGALNSIGVPAVGISGRDGAMARCSRIKKLGFVGEPESINTKLLSTLMKAGFTVVVSSIGCDAKGQALNMNADSMAMAIACALKARRLILLTDVPGVLDGKKKTIPRIRCKEVNGLLSNGTITGGMIPKIKACAGSVGRGIKEVWIADGASGLTKLKGTVITK